MSDDDTMETMEKMRDSKALNNFLTKESDVRLHFIAVNFMLAVETRTDHFLPHLVLSRQRRFDRSNILLYHSSESR